MTYTIIGKLLVKSFLNTKWKLVDSNSYHLILSDDNQLSQVDQNLLSQKLENISVSFSGDTSSGYMSYDRMYHVSSGSLKRIIQPATRDLNYFFQITESNKLIITTEKTKDYALLLHNDKGPAWYNSSPTGNQFKYDWYLEGINYGLEGFLFATNGLSEEEKLLFRIKYS